MFDRKVIREALRDDLATLRVVNSSIRTCANSELPRWLKVQSALLRNVRYNLRLLHAAIERKPPCNKPN
jgi:hypothetical protein